MFKVKASVIAFALLALSAGTFSGAARADFNADERFDVESPAEIAAARARIEAEFPDANAEVRALSQSEEIAILDKYSYLDPKHEVNKTLLAATLQYLEDHTADFPNQNYITVVDFGLKSDQYRIFMINMGSGEVEKFHTTHGVNSDPKDTGWATSFDNVVNGGKTSLGFARTTDTYTGHYGLSVRLDGLSPTNSNIRERAVVYHGWEKTKEADIKQARSHGCLTLDFAVRDQVIDKVKGGSLVNFTYSTIHKGN